MITEGLFADNLAALSSLAKELFPQCPVLYGTLLRVFDFIEAEYHRYGGQGLPTARYSQITSALQQTLLDALDAESSSAADLVEKLNRLHLKLFSLYEE
jgi:hypothetical protein